MNTTSRLRDWFLLLACNLIWAGQFVMVKLVQSQMGPVFATSFPMAIATSLLIPIVRYEKRKKGPAGDGPIPASHVLDFILIGVCGQVVAQLFITWGVRLSNASNAGLLMLTLPISTAVMAYIFLGERMTAVRWASFVLAIVGVLQCSGVDWKELKFSSGRFLLGTAMNFLSVNGSAFYNAYSKRLLARYSPLEVLLYSYYAVCALLLPITLYVEPEGFRNLIHYRATVWLGLAILALFQYFLSMVIFLNVLSRLDATQAGLSNYLIPFFGVLLAALFGERLTRAMVAGGILVLASTLLVTVYEERLRAKAAATGTASHP